MRSTLRRSGFSLALGAAALIGFSAALGDARPVPAQQAVTPGSRAGRLATVLVEAVAPNRYSTTRR